MALKANFAAKNIISLLVIQRLKRLTATLYKEKYSHASLTNLINTNDYVCCFRMKWYRFSQLSAHFQAHLNTDNLITLALLSRVLLLLKLAS